MGDLHWSFFKPENRVRGKVETKSTADKKSASNKKRTAGKDAAATGKKGASCIRDDTDQYLGKSIIFTGAKKPGK